MFQPIDWHSPNSSYNPKQLVLLQPESSTDVVFPVYVRKELRAGEFERLYEVHAISESEITSRRVPLIVSRGNLWVTCTMLVACILNVFLWIQLFLFGRVVIKRFSLQELTTISFLSAFHFVIAYLFFLINTIILSLLGPLAVFVSGVGNEGATTLVLACTFILVPRRGTLFISMTIVFLLNGIFYGQIGLVDCFLFAASATVMELFITPFLKTKNSSSSRPSKVSIILIGFSIGLASSISMLMHFTSAQLLYRLYYDLTYILSACIIVGGVYSFIGAILGGLIGRKFQEELA